jgi:hypothetical protein
MPTIGYIQVDYLTVVASAEAKPRRPKTQTFGELLAGPR